MRSSNAAAGWVAALPFGHQRQVFIEDLASFELRDIVASGTTTVLVPIQNGPHIAQRKHNILVKVLAGLIAERLGNAVVEPVLAYVPEGTRNAAIADIEK